MRAAIVCLGDEVLSGSVINTNAAYLATKLTQMGFSVEVHLVVSDFDPENFSRLQKLTAEYPLVICSGGLGPTLDDLTRALLAKLAQTDLVFDESIYKDLIQRFKEHPYHRFQAMRPKTADILINSIGTACGYHLAIGASHLIALPGVHYEMKVMSEQQLTPLLHHIFPYLKPGYEETAYFFDLLEVDVDPILQEFKRDYPGLNIGIYPSFGSLRVVIRGQNRDVVIPKIALLKEKFKAHLYASTNGKIGGAIHQWFSEHNKTLSTAESITGGRIASELTRLSGASEYYVGSVIAYSNTLKEQLLLVPKLLINEKGAVSPEVAEAMLRGLLAKTEADFGIATTGIAGPTGQTASKPLGLVYIAIGKAGEPVVIKKCQFSGDRELVMEKTTTYALGYLYQYLLAN